MSIRNLTRSAAGAVLGVAIAVAWGIIPAGAVTTTGVSVAAVGSNTVVGTTGNTATLTNAIRYFIPLLDDNGTYGLGPNCAKGFGTCSDTGDGGGILKMVLKFTPVDTTAPTVLKIVFEDLDLKNANDPDGFFEQIKVVVVGKTSTDWIDTLGSLITGDASLQTLTLSLGLLTSDPLYVKLFFQASYNYWGTNTPEYLFATLTTHTPLPGAVWLMGTVLLGAAGFAKWRKRRRTVEI